MPKLIGIKKFNIAVFISGTGSNLKNLIKHSLRKKSKFKIKLVISNKSKIKGLEHAKKFKIRKIFTKDYKPYVIGKIISGKNKVKLNGKIDWS